MDAFSKTFNGMVRVLAFVGFGICMIGCSKGSNSLSGSTDKSSLDAKTTMRATTQNVSDSCFADTFQVPPVAAKPVDVLFVLETSQSMSDIRQTIINGINGFVAGLPADSNFNIAVMLSHGSTSQYSGVLFQAGSEPAVLQSSQLSNSQIETYLDAKINQAPQDAPNGGGEEGMFSLFNGITTPSLLSVSQSAGFFRSNAALSVVFIADRRDICAVIPAGVPPETDPDKIAARDRDCEGLTAAGLTNRLKNLKGAQTLQIGGIIYVDSPAPTGKEIGYGYTDMISLNSGFAIDIAQDNITTGLAPVTALSGQTGGGQSVFTLTRTNIDASSVQVTVNGQSVPFTVSGNQVTLATPAPEGATVMVSYCQNAGDNPYVGLCQIYSNPQLNSLTPTASTQDLQLVGKAGNTSVGAVRNLQVLAVSGSLSVQSAMDVSSIMAISGRTYLHVTGDIDSINGVSGSFRIDKAGNINTVSNVAGTLQLNAETLGTLSNLAGDACIQANTIGSIHSSAGTKTLIANEIDQLTTQAGTIHVYGATVKSLTNMAGRVCLHNGATVLHSSNIAGFVGTCP